MMNRLCLPAVLLAALLWSPVPPAAAQTKGSKATSGVDTAPMIVRSGLRFYAFRDGHFVLVDGYEYRSRGGTPVPVPPGFVTDFASIPPKLRRFASRGHDLPGVMHDYLYWRQCPQGVADLLFQQALVEAGVPFAESMAMYGGLVAAGAKGWLENTVYRLRGLPRVIPGRRLPPPDTTWNEFRRQLKEERVPLDAIGRGTEPKCPRLL